MDDATPLQKTLLDTYGVTVDAWEGEARPQPQVGGAPQPPQRLARYPVVGELGRGGMGAVLEVADPDLGRTLAAKVLHEQVGGAPHPPELIARFVREARICGQLQHPNIVPVHELAATPEGKLYFTMKRVEGTTLRGLVREQRAGRGPTLVGLLQTYLKLCDAIAYAHDQRVIHRDLKPDNVMIGEHGEVLVMDWGLAKPLDGGELALTPSDENALIDASPIQTLDGAVVGTPSYMPPEQAQGDLASLDERADIYSLGAILYELLTLEVPFTGRSLTVVLNDVSEGALVPPRERAPERELPWELEAVVLKAMSVKRHQRYRSVGELVADVQAFLEGRAVGAIRYSSAQLLGKWIARNKALVAASAAVLVVAVTLGVISYVNISRSAQEARASERAAVAEREAARVAEREAREQSAQRQVALERSRRSLAEALVAKAQGMISEGRVLDAGLLLAEAESIEPRLPALVATRYQLTPPLIEVERLQQVGEATDTVRGVAFDDGGETLAVACHSRVMLLTPGEAQPRATLAHDAVITGLAFRPEHPQTLVAVDTRGSVHLWDLAASPPASREIAVGIGELKRVVWRADGGQFAVGSIANHVAIYAPDGSLVSKARPWAHNGYYVAALAYDGAALAIGGQGWALAVLDGRNRRLEGHIGPVRDLVRARGQLISTGNDRRVLVWPGRGQGGDPRELLSLGSAGSALAHSDDGEWLMVGTLGGELLMQSLIDPQALRVVTIGAAVSALACGPDGWLACGDRKGRLTLLRQATGAHRRRRLPHEHGAICLAAIDPRGRRVTSVNYFGELVETELRDGGLRKLTESRLEGRRQGDDNWQVCYRPDGRLLCSFLSGRIVELDPAQPGTSREIFQLGSSIAWMTLDRSGRWLTVLGGERSVLLDLERDAAVALELGKAPFRSTCAFAADADAERLAVGGAPPRVFERRGSRWVLMDLPELAREGRVSGVALSPDGGTLVTAESSGDLRIWDLETGKAGRRLRGHSDYVRALAIPYSDPPLLFSGSIGNDALAYVWDLESGRQLISLEGHIWGVSALAFGPAAAERPLHRPLLTIGSNDQSIIVRGVDTPASVPVAQRRAGLALRDGKLQRLTPSEHERLRVAREADRAPVPWPPSAADPRRRAGHLLREGQPRFAISLFDRALAREESWSARWHRARCHVFVYQQQVAGRAPTAADLQRLRLALADVDAAIPLAPAAQRPPMETLQRQLRQATQR